MDTNQKREREKEIILSSVSGHKTYGCHHTKQKKVKKRREIRK